MARIAGVDLPKKKRVEYGLTYIYGIGLYTSRKILDAVGISYDKRVYELSEDEAAAIRKEIQEHYMVEGDLRKSVAMDITEKVCQCVVKKQKQTQELEKAEEKLLVLLLNKDKIWQREK